MANAKLIAEFEAVLLYSYKHAADTVLLVGGAMDFNKLNLRDEVSKFIVEFMNEWSSYGDKIKKLLPKKTVSEDDLFDRLTTEVKQEVTAMIKQAESGFTPQYFDRQKSRLARKLAHTVDSAS